MRGGGVRAGRVLVGTATVAALAMLAATPLARAQDAVELTEPIRREADQFEIRVPKQGEDYAPKRPTTKLVRGLPTLGGPASVIAVEVLPGETPTRWLRGLRAQGYAQGYQTETVRESRDDATRTDAMLRCLRTADGQVDEMYFVAAPGRCFQLLFRYPGAKQAVWTGIVRDVLASFRVLDATATPSQTKAAPPPAPTFDGATIERHPELGCAFALPRGATPTKDPPEGYAFLWDYALTGTAGVVIGLIFSEPAEPWPAFLQSVVRRWEGDGYLHSLDLRGEKAPPGLDAVLSFVRSSDGLVQRCCCFRREGFAMAAVFTYYARTEKVWEPFTAEWCKRVEWLGQPTGLPSRLPGHALGPVVVEEHGGMEFRVPAGVEPTDNIPGRTLHTWFLKDGSGAKGVITLIEGEEGETLEELLDAFRTGHQAMGAKVEAVVAEHDAIRGTAACLRMVKAETDDRFNFWFLRRGGRWFGWSFTHGAAEADDWARVTDRVLIHFRVTSASDARFSPPTGASTETQGPWSFKVEPGVPKRAIASLREELELGLRLGRQLTGGPEVEPPRTVHCFAKPERLQLVVPATDADTPTALYLAERRLFLAHALSRTRRPQKGSGDRYAAGLRAYVDAWLGTEWGLPPWLEVGLHEAALTAKADKDAVACDWRRSDLAAWAKKARPRWPDCATFLRRRTPLERDAERAYALALVLTLLDVDLDGKASGWSAVIPRYFTHLQRRGLPAEALDVALEGVDLAALDAAARALLGG